MKNMNELATQMLKKFAGFPRWAQVTIILGGMGIFAVGSFFLQTGNAASPAEDPFANSTGLALDVFFKLIIVVALIFIGSIVLRRVKGQKAFRSTRQMALKESINLSPKRALHLIEVNGKTYMIGSTDQSVNLIAEVANAENEIVAGEAESIPVGEFQNLLSNSIKHKGA